MYVVGSGVEVDGWRNCEEVRGGAMETQERERKEQGEPTSDGRGCPEGSAKTTEDCKERTICERHSSVSSFHIELLKSRISCVDSEGVLGIREGREAERH